MPRRRKKTKPEYTSIVATIDDYDVETRASINMFMDSAMRDFTDDKEPVYTFETDLTIRGRIIDPSIRTGHEIEVTLLGASYLPRRLRYRIKQFQKRDDKDMPVYKKYRDGEYPVYEKPKGVARLEKIRGEDGWRVWMQTAPQMVSDTLAMLSGDTQAYLSFQEMKVDRQRWVQYLTVTTSNPAEE